MARINLSTIEQRLEQMKRADNSWVEVYVRDVSHLLMLLKTATEPVNPVPAEHVAWCRYVDDGNRIVLCDSDSKGAFKVYATPAPWANMSDEELKRVYDEVEGAIPAEVSTLGITLEVARKLLNLREALAHDNIAEAWHWLYKVADSEVESFTPWAKLEALASSSEPVASTRLPEDRRRVYDEATKAREQRWANELVASTPAGSRYSRHNHLGGFSKDCAECNPLTPADKCVLCRHRKNVDREGYCKVQVSPVNYRDVTYCGCKCEFLVPVSGEVVEDDHDQKLGQRPQKTVPATVVEADEASVIKESGYEQRNFQPGK